ncbi:hypothetical protein K438DRAFT_2028908 [Mycena galopus ATCC 62051]|nr:hypothetical protein K438DRAFT_2028908 [Mycena galopus ATCC 62051]
MGCLAPPFPPLLHPVQLQSPTIGTHVAPSEQITAMHGRYSTTSRILRPAMPPFRRPTGYSVPIDRRIAGASMSVHTRRIPSSWFPLPLAHRPTPARQQLARSRSQSAALHMPGASSLRRSRLAASRPLALKAAVDNPRCAVRAPRAHHQALLPSHAPRALRRHPRCTLSEASVIRSCFWPTPPSVSLSTHWSRLLSHLHRVLTRRFAHRERTHHHLGICHVPEIASSVSLFLPPEFLEGISNSFIYLPTLCFAVLLSIPIVLPLSAPLVLLSYGPFVRNVTTPSPTPSSLVPRPEIGNPHRPRLLTFRPSVSRGRHTQLSCPPRAQACLPQYKPARLRSGNTCLHSQVAVLPAPHDELLPLRIFPLPNLPLEVRMLLSHLPTTSRGACFKPFASVISTYQAFLPGSQLNSDLLRQVAALPEITFIVTIRAVPKTFDAQMDVSICGLRIAIYRTPARMAPLSFHAKLANNNIQVSVSALAGVVPKPFRFWLSNCTRRAGARHLSPASRRFHVRRFNPGLR